MSNCGNCGGVLKPGGGCGCLNCPAGPAGLDGINGLSAYELWIEDGNAGTVTEFLDSLVGEPGDDGNYVVQTAEPVGVNCLYGGTMIQVYDGVTAALISTTYVCNGEPGSSGVGAKENFYEQHVATQDVIEEIYYHPTGYEILTYTNNSGLTKKYLVQGTYDTETQISAINSENYVNWVDGAIIKTVLGVDSIEYQSLGSVGINGFLFEGPLNTDVVNEFSANKLFSDAEIGGVQQTVGAANPGTGYTNPGANGVATTNGTGTGLLINYTTDGAGAVSTVSVSEPGAYHGSGYTVGDVITIQDGNLDATFTISEVTLEITPIEWRWNNVKLPLNKSILQHVTLNDGETVSLKFKTKLSSTGSMRTAQFSVLEIDI